MTTSHNTKSRSTQDYYTPDDYEYVMDHLPDIIDIIKRKAMDVLEPTLSERIKIRSIILEFIKNKQRKVYGGSAVNAEIKEKDPTDAIYDEYTHKDIEFYTPTPIQDMMELSNLLHEKGYEHIEAKEAMHEETYSIYVNFSLYCDVTYVPKLIYDAIKVIDIGGVKYVDPHFILIDQLRIINQPLTAADQRWLKTFERMYLLLKHYPLEKYGPKINVPEPEKSISDLINKIKSEFLSDLGNKLNIISGYDAYNFYINYAQKVPPAKHQNKTSNLKYLGKYTCPVPYIDIISVNYEQTVINLYNWLKVNANGEITYEEHYPFFQFLGRSVIFYINGTIIAIIYNANGFCVPSVSTDRGYYYVTYQYLLMNLLMFKFRSFVNKRNKKNTSQEIDAYTTQYYAYGTAISNLIATKNDYLREYNLNVINNTIFGDFKYACLGSTVDPFRESRLRTQKKCNMGRYPFKYDPELFNAMAQEKRDKFYTNALEKDRHHNNTAGAIIKLSKNLDFELADGKLIENTYCSQVTDIGSETDDMERLNQLDSLTMYTENDKIIE